MMREVIRSKQLLQRSLRHIALRCAMISSGSRRNLADMISASLSLERVPLTFIDRHCRACPGNPSSCEEDGPAGQDPMQAQPTWWYQCGVYKPPPALHRRDRWKPVW